MSEFVGNNQFSGLTLGQRFWQKVRVMGEKECWEWKGSTHWQWGYGSFNYKGKYMAAHRMAWKLIFGEISDGLVVCHKCDNPPCVNPFHLFLGTVADNNLDKKLKGREPSAKGSNNNRSKLTEKDVIEIRRKRKQGVSGASLGREYGVVKETIYDVCSGKKWSHVRDEL